MDQIFNSGKILTDEYLSSVVYFVNLIKTISCHPCGVKLKDNLELFSNSLNTQQNN